MTKIMKYQWAKHKDKFRECLAEAEGLDNYEYIDLVRLAFTVFFNADSDELGLRVNTARITQIDDGDYQGTLLFVIPFDTYQPEEREYLMTFVGYGSCSGCDTLLNLQATSDVIGKEDTLSGYMDLCKDIIANTIKPYNFGWRRDSAFEPAEEEL